MFLLSANPKHLLVISDDRLFRLDIASGEQISQINHEDVSAVAKSLGGGDRRIAIAGRRKRGVRDLTEPGTVVCTVENTGSLIMAITMSRVGKFVVTSHSDKYLRFGVLK